MCEKNFEGKIMSLSPTDSDDINEEIIISDDMEEIVEIMIENAWENYPDG